MVTTLAIDVIQVLQKDEIEAFRDFLNSPYFNKRQNIEQTTLFFEAIYSAIQHGRIESMEKKDLSDQLFPGKPYVESKIDKLMSELKRLLERFIITQKYLDRQNERHHLLDFSIEMRLRGLEIRYQQSLEKTKKLMDTFDQESLENLLFRYLVAMEEQEWHSKYNRAKGDLNLPATILQLDNYYLTRRTALHNQLMLQLRVAALPVSIEDFGVDTWEVPAKNLESSPLLVIYWEIHRLFIKNTWQPEDFDQLLQLIQKNEQLVQPESLAEFYAYLRSLCVLLIDDGYVHLYAVLHEINKANLERGYFYQDGKISPNSYLNITQVAIGMGAYEWAAQFVEQHKNMVVGENPSQDFYRMNKALYLFGEKKYDEALDTIPFGSTYSFYHLMARRLELKIFYELQSDLLDAKIDAFKMFISRAGRKVFSPSLHELYTNFVNFVRQINDSQGPKGRQRSPVLIKRINEKKLVAERLWLLEKARELEKNK